MKRILMVVILANVVILSACQWQGFGKKDITTNETKIPVSSEVKGK